MAGDRRRHVRTLASAKVNLERRKSRRRVCGVLQGSGWGPSRLPRPWERCVGRYSLPTHPRRDHSVMDTKLRARCNRSALHRDGNFASHPPLGIQGGAGVVTSVTPLPPAAPLPHQRLLSSEKHLGEGCVLQGDMASSSCAPFVSRHPDQCLGCCSDEGVSCPEDPTDTHISHALRSTTTAPNDQFHHAPRPQRIQDVLGSPKRRPRVPNSWRGRRSGLEILLASLLPGILTVLLLLLPTHALPDGGPPSLPTDGHPALATPQQNLTVPAGRVAKLTCVVEDLGMYKVAWTHYGESGRAVLTVDTNVITKNDRVSLVKESGGSSWSLVIRNVSTSDAGEYMCQVSTVPPERLYLHLSIVVPPRITKLPLDVEADEGQEVRLECEATGDPKPTYAWRREDLRPFQQNGSTVGVASGPLLVLPSVTRNSSGAYLCVASNGIQPAVSARAKVSVKFVRYTLTAMEAVSVISRNHQHHLYCTQKHERQYRRCSATHTPASRV